LLDFVVHSLTSTINSNNNNWATIIKEEKQEEETRDAISSDTILKTEVSRSREGVLQALKEKKRIIPCIHNKYVSKKDVKWGLSQFHALNFVDIYELALELSRVVNN
jgi:hypothetical protein